MKFIEAKIHIFANLEASGKSQFVCQR